jgi:hypothetical protein
MDPAGRILAGRVWRKATAGGVLAPRELEGGLFICAVRCDNP